MDEIKIYERLAKLEAGQQFTNETLGEVKLLLTDHCKLEVETERTIATLGSSVKTYKKITWVSLCVMLSAGVKALLIP